MFESRELMCTMSASSSGKASKTRKLLSPRTVTPLNLLEIIMAELEGDQAPSGGPSQVLRSMNSVLQRVGGKAELKRRTKDGLLVPATQEEIEWADATASLQQAALLLSQLDVEKQMGWAVEARLRGNDAFTRGKYREAMRLYLESLLGLQPAHPDTSSVRVITLSNMAACAIKLRDHEQAIALCAQALSADPKCFKALCRRATALSHLSRFGEARSDLLRASGVAQGKDQSAEISRLFRHLAQLEKASTQSDRRLKEFAQGIVTGLHRADASLYTESESAVSAVTGMESPRGLTGIQDGCDSARPRDLVAIMRRALPWEWLFEKLRRCMQWMMAAARALETGKTEI